ncbi:MAG: hypothetical protein PHN49_10910 [Candidatus Omnitrophica bacterium]|nr:hypothetical protein [Candidatus Omnitrophota bacterium]
MKHCHFRHLAFLLMFLWMGGSFAQLAVSQELPPSISQTPPAAAKIIVDVDGGGIHFDRSRNFKIANTGEWGDVVIRGLPGREEPLSFNRDDWGGGYEITATLPGKKFDYQLSFSQSFSANTQTKDNLPAVGAGQLTLVGFIDGQAHATDQSFGYFVSASPIALQTRASAAKFDYTLHYYDISFRGTYHLLEKNRFRFDLFAGPSFVRFFQDFRLNTWGTNAVNGGPTSSTTDEKLAENLFGGRLGFLGHLELCKKIFLSFEQVFGGFLNAGRLTASQEIVHGSGMMGGGFNFADLNERISMRDSDSKYTSHFSSQIELGYKMTRWATLSFFYQFDQWLWLSGIENPVVSADLKTVQNSETNIQEHENLGTHMIGGKVVFSF